MESGMEGAGGGTRSRYCLSMHITVGSKIVIVCYRVVLL
jgi:hypothetical protein